MSEQPNPDDMKAFNAKVIAEFRANKGQLTGALANSRVLLLTTTGARSGQQRTTVVGYRRRGHDYVLIDSNNGAPGSLMVFQSEGESGRDSRGRLGAIQCSIQSCGARGAPGADEGR